MHKKVLKIINSVAQTLYEKNLIKSQEKIFLTVSGGQDSICLLFISYLLRKRLLIDFDLIWCNHFWQTSSFFTMLHVAKCNFCCSSTILFFLPLNKVVSERIARDWRYQVIQRTALFYGSTITAQAHTKSDRIETVLFNLIRGTGPTGITTLPLSSTRYFFYYNMFYPIVMRGINVSHVSEVYECKSLDTFTKKMQCFYSSSIAESYDSISVLDFPYEDKHRHLQKSSFNTVNTKTTVAAHTSIEDKHSFNLSNSHVGKAYINRLSTFTETRNIEFFFLFLHYQDSKNRFCVYSLLKLRISHTSLYVNLNDMRFQFIRKAYNIKLLELLNQKQVDLSFLRQSLDTVSLRSGRIGSRKYNAFASDSVLVRGVTSDTLVGNKSVHLQSRSHNKLDLRVPLRKRSSCSDSAQYKDVIKNKLYTPNHHNFFNQLKRLNHLGNLINS